MRTAGPNWRRRLYVPADTLRVIAELLRPFMPQTAERMLAMLGQGAGPASWASLQAER
jgi:methionyl-tRNA synthetase